MFLITTKYVKCIKAIIDTYIKIEVFRHEIPVYYNR